MGRRRGGTDLPGIGGGEPRLIRSREPTGHAGPTKQNTTPQELRNTKEERWTHGSDT
jgi:hypothetical protein